MITSWKQEAISTFQKGNNQHLMNNSLDPVPYTCKHCGNYLSDTTISALALKGDGAVTKQATVKCGKCRRTQTWRVGKYCALPTLPLREAEIAAQIQTSLSDGMRQQQQLKAEAAPPRRDKWIAEMERRAEEQAARANSDRELKRA